MFDLHQNSDSERYSYFCERIEKWFEKNLSHIQIKISFRSSVNWSIKNLLRRRFNKKFNSFKTEIFAIRLSSTFEFQFQSIEDFARRKFLMQIKTSNSSNSIFLSAISFCSTSTILLISQSNYLLVANQFAAQISYQHIVIMISTYEERLITYKNWFHNKFSTINMIVVDFIRQFCIKNITNCSKCLMIFDDWFVDSDSLRMHFDESDCSLTQTLNDIIVAQKAIEQEIVVVFKS